MFAPKSTLLVLGLLVLNALHSTTATAFATIVRPHHGGKCSTFLNSGEQLIEETDLVVPGRGMDFALVRRYQSQSIYDGPFGWGWDYNCHRRLQELPDGSVYYYDGLGGKQMFQPGRTLDVITSVLVKRKRSRRLRYRCQHTLAEGQKFDKRRTGQFDDGGLNRHDATRQTL